MDTIRTSFRLLGSFAFAIGCCCVSHAGAAEKPSQRWALLIGVNDYAYCTDLKYSCADQESLSQELVRAGFPADQVFLLQDKAEEKKDQPFRENMNRQIDLVLGLAEPGDLVVVAFSGHGMWAKDKSWLLPTEARPEDPENTMISLESVYERLSKSKATLKLLLVDACRNEVVPGGERSLTPTRSAADFAQSLGKPPEGILLLASCAPGQTSMEDEKFGHGVFMHYLLEGLRGQAADEDGDISLARLYDFASLNTKKYVARKWSKYQTPALKGELNGPFPIARIDNIRPGQAITNSIGMKLVPIPAGEFEMGATPEDIALVLKEFPETEADAFQNEQPRHHVRITKPFHIGKYEVTLRQFLTFYHAAKYKCECETNDQGGVGYDTSGTDRKFGFSPTFVPWNTGFEQTMEHPVVNVTWNDAKAFCKWLSEKEGKTYRLPSEAEWEYACRAGTKTRYYNGSVLESLVDIANVADADAAAIFPNWQTTAASDGYAYSAPVGSFKANAFGLHDMLGNVWEWCEDRHQPDYYQNFANRVAVDPTGPDDGGNRIMRGGSWFFSPKRVRASTRDYVSPDSYYLNWGFRVVCE